MFLPLQRGRNIGLNNRVVYVNILVGFIDNGRGKILSVCCKQNK